MAKKYKLLIVLVLLSAFAMLLVKTHLQYKVEVPRYTDQKIKAVIETKSLNLQAHLLSLLEPQNWPQSRAELNISRALSPTEKIVYELAPQIWWHSKEEYTASDPLEFIQHSELIRWRQSAVPFFSERETLIKAGDIKPEDLKSYYEILHRPHESNGVERGRSGVALKVSDISIFKNKKNPAPLFWRLSLHPQIDKFDERDPNSMTVLIEYWYHIAHNPLPFYLGSHQGDWESLAYLVQIVYLSEPNELSYHVRGIYLSAHGRGRWHCPQEISQIQTENKTRNELFSALGTHATYARAGKGDLGLVPDHTERGTAWKTWEFLLPMQLEPYYGFTGAWGDVSDLHWSMTGPMPPSPHYKYLPKGEEIQFDPSVDCR